jgi:hypothetical protein
MLNKAAGSNPLGFGPAVTVEDECVSIEAVGVRL